VQNPHDDAPRPYPFISCDLATAAQTVGLSVTEIQKAVSAGDLVPNYRGRKPLFRADELDSWVRSLPNAPVRR
jgi:hypothetical protein